MKVIYYNNCWFTNVGEAFIDIGATELIKRVFPEPEVACCSDMSNYYCESIDRNARISKQVYTHMRCDYFIFAGMFATIGFLNSEGRKMVDYFKSTGSKILILGLGSGTYSDSERIAFGEYIKSLKPELIVTRDKYTYDAYKSVANCMIGLDCAFWVIDKFKPTGFASRDYDVVSFNRSDEPRELEALTGNIIKAWHMPYTLTEKHIYNNTMVSDSPYDYLTLYANARSVYTDLVHATIISLMYGVPVKYWYIDRRIESIEVLEGLYTRDGWLVVKKEDLASQKEAIIDTIKRRLWR